MTTRYDFVVEYQGHLSRVQVKSTMFVDRGGYSCSVRGWRGPYEGNPFDFLVVYVIPEDVWYIIPAEKFHMQGSIALYPYLKRSKYRKYKEAWHLLRGDTIRDGVVARIEACAEEFVLTARREISEGGGGGVGSVSALPSEGSFSQAAVKIIRLATRNDMGAAKK